MAFSCCTGKSPYKESKRKELERKKAKQSNSSSVNFIKSDLKREATIFDKPVVENYKRFFAPSELFQANSDASPYNIIEEKNIKI